MVDMKKILCLREYPEYMDIKKGDTVLVSSDTRKMLWDAVMNCGSQDLNSFLDGLIDNVGKEGTIIIPTYNWDFCSGVSYDIRQSPCMTGALGTAALRRDDFIRTKHAIYSFAVWGALSEKLYSMDNKDSFGEDSPFAYFKDWNVVNYIIDVDLQHCFTYVHYVEEQSGYVKYRYIKDFTADYIDEKGERSSRIYSMFVRRLDINVKTTINPIEKEFLRNGIEKKYHINSSLIKRIDLRSAYDIILEDIVNNKSKLLCTYTGQEG